MATCFGFLLLSGHCTETYGTCSAVYVVWGPRTLTAPI